MIKPGHSIADLYKAVTPKHYEIKDASIAVRVYGQGPALVLIHGFIVHGYTWRKLLPELSKHFTCYVLDLPGFGDSRWSKKTGFTFTAQADRLMQLFDKMGLDSFHILAHDTGASIARMVASARPGMIAKLILINTEIPGHRPPFIPMYQFLALLPGANMIFRSLLKMGFVVRSPLLLKQFFYDTSLLRDRENIDPYLLPLKSSQDKMFGMLGYLKGIEWHVVDGFKETHKKIAAKTLLIWGEEDKTFPVRLAENMTTQFKAPCRFTRIPKASLMPHEERPGEILKYVIPFLLA